MHGQLNVETGGGDLNMGGGVLPRVWGKTPFCKARFVGRGRRAQNKRIIPLES